MHAAIGAIFSIASVLFWGSAQAESAMLPSHFPRALDAYSDPAGATLFGLIAHRIDVDPFNLVAALIFVAAILHTFLTGRFTAIARRLDDSNQTGSAHPAARQRTTRGGARLMALLGEIESVFGVWGVALIVAITAYHDWGTAVDYMGSVNFTEPMFVVVIMTLSATRPILKLSATLIGSVANLFGGGVKAWWWSLLTVGPLLGSAITEPAAITITAMLLAERFYALEPGTRLKYATISLLFVNVSVGGTLTHFAAPPVLMVAATWEWDSFYMLTTFGWKAVLGILITNGLYFFLFRSELEQLQERFALRKLEAEIREKFLDRVSLERENDAAGYEISRELGFVGLVREQVGTIAGLVRDRLEKSFIERIQSNNIDPALARRVFRERYDEIYQSRLRADIPFLLPPETREHLPGPEWETRDDPVPLWVTLVHVGFLVWTVFNAHHPELFVPGLLFFIGFAEVTATYQNRIDLKSPLLVGFFLGGLVVHGGLQGWWIAPLLESLGEAHLMVGATVLSAFNDNAAITFLATLVPDLTVAAQYAVVAGAVAGGGLTVIANAPNPAGLSILKIHFKDRFSSGALLAASLAPTLIMLCLFSAFD